jgi:cell division protein FtsI (penicillin-binding protein 3)
MAGKRHKKARQVQRQPVALPSFAARRYGVLAVFVLAGAVLVWRAVDQQILEKDFLQSEGADRYLDRVRQEAHRGLITDRRGEVLALSTPVDSVTANPRVLTPDTAHLTDLAKALDMPATVLRKRLERYAQRRFVYLKKGLPPGRAEYVLKVADAFDIDGVHLEHKYRRYYPEGEAFAHVLGFTNSNDQGQEGLERAYDKALRGENGEKLVLRDGRRRVVDDVENIRSPRDGQNLALSIDGRLQYIAYRELKAAVHRNRAIGGSAVLLDAKTGEVLAMVNQPGYNPNGDRSNKGGQLRNRALTDVFEPGSTMKPFVVAAALEQGVIQASSLIDTSPGMFKVASLTIHDHHNLGRISPQTLLARSSNVGAAKLALSLDKAAYWRLLDALGFGKAPETGYPAEGAGRLPYFREWVPVDQATLSYGYGISASALQLAQAYAVLANDGVKLPVSLLKLARAPEGERVMGRRTALDVRHMLEAVVAQDGTAPEAQVQGYRVAGKTGTARKLGRDGEYSDDRYRSVFAGMAPVDDPRLVMAVVIDEPQGKYYYGGQVAAPVFSRVMGEALRLLNVAPDALSRPQLRLAQLGGDQ